MKTVTVDKVKVGDRIVKMLGRSWVVTRDPDDGEKSRTRFVADDGEGDVYISLPAETRVDVLEDGE